MKRFKSLIALVTVAAAITACGGAPEATTGTNPNQHETQPSIVDETVNSAPQRAISTVEQLTVTATPGGQDTIATLGRTTSFGSARVLLVTDTKDSWVQVLLPTRPNGTHGWVHRDAVTLQPVDYSVSVNLEARTLVVHEAGSEILRATIAVGTEENPTPTGDFFITDKLETPESGGAYGPYAFGISAYSDTLTEFAGGEGQIGIHGTNEPDKLGTAVSHGCVRLSNEEITLLAERLPLGTPVSIS